jgi:hypothetical protein
MTKASDQNRRKPRRVGLRHQAAPTVDIDIAPDQVDDLQRELAEFPDLREIMAYNGDEAFLCTGFCVSLISSSISEPSGIGTGANLPPILNC